MHVENWNGDVPLGIEAPSFDTATSTIARQQASLSSKQWRSQAGAHWACAHATRGCAPPVQVVPIVLLSIASQAAKNLFQNLEIAWGSRPPKSEIQRAHAVSWHCWWPGYITGSKTCRAPSSWIWRDMNSHHKWTTAVSKSDRTGRAQLHPAWQLQWLVWIIYYVSGR